MTSGQGAGEPLPRPHPRHPVGAAVELIVTQLFPAAPWEGTPEPGVEVLGQARIVSPATDSDDGCRAAGP